MASFGRLPCGTRPSFLSFPSRGPTCSRRAHEARAGHGAVLKHPPRLAFFGGKTSSVSSSVFRRRAVPRNVVSRRPATSLTTASLSTTPPSSSWFSSSKPHDNAFWRGMVKEEGVKHPGPGGSKALPLDDHNNTAFTTSADENIGGDSGFAPSLAIRGAKVTVLTVTFVALYFLAIDHAIGGSHFTASLDFDYSQVLEAAIVKATAVYSALLATEPAKYLQQGALAASASVESLMTQFKNVNVNVDPSQASQALAAALAEAAVIYTALTSTVVTWTTAMYSFIMATTPVKYLQVALGRSSTMTPLLATYAAGVSSRVVSYIPHAAATWNALNAPFTTMYDARIYTAVAMCCVTMARLLTAMVLRMDHGTNGAVREQQSEEEEEEEEEANEDDIRSSVSSSSSASFSSPSSHLKKMVSAVAESGVSTLGINAVNVKSSSSGRVVPQGGMKSEVGMGSSRAASRKIIFRSRFVPPLHATHAATGHQTEQPNDDVQLVEEMMTAESNANNKSFFVDQLVNHSPAATAATAAAAAVSNVDSKKLENATTTTTTAAAAASYSSSASTTPRADSFTVAVLEYQRRARARVEAQMYQNKGFAPSGIALETLPEQAQSAAAAAAEKTTPSTPASFKLVVGAEKGPTWTRVGRSRPPPSSERRSPFTPLIAQKSEQEGGGGGGGGGRGGMSREQQEDLLEVAALKNGEVVTEVVKVAKDGDVESSVVRKNNVVAVKGAAKEEKKESQETMVPERGAFTKSTELQERVGAGKKMLDEDVSSAGQTARVVDTEIRAGKKTVKKEKPTKAKEKGMNKKKGRSSKEPKASQKQVDEEKSVVEEADDKGEGASEGAGADEGGEGDVEVETEKEADDSASTAGEENVKMEEEEEEEEEVMAAGEEDVLAPAKKAVAEYRNNVVKITRSAVSVHEEYDLAKSAFKRAKEQALRLM